MFVKPADMLQLEFWSIKRKIPQPLGLNVVVQHIILNRRLLIHVAGVENLLTKEAIFIKKVKPQLNTQDEQWGGWKLKYYAKCKKFNF